MNLLLVDDDPSEKDLLQEAIKGTKACIDLTAIQDCTKLISYLEWCPGSELPDIILMDINMPPHSGFECLKELKRHKDFGQLAVMMYSTSYREDSMRTAHELGANGYICKPHDFNKMKVLVKAISAADPASLHSHLSFKDFQRIY